MKKFSALTLAVVLFVISMSFPAFAASTVAKIGETPYDSLKAAIDNATEGDVIILEPGEFEVGIVNFPTVLKNVTIKGAEGNATILKNSSLQSEILPGKWSDPAYKSEYHNITIDGIVFENSYIKFTGRASNALNQSVSYKDWKITNCTFKNVADEAAVAFNLASAFAGQGDEAVENFTFTNNVINGVLGTYSSGLSLIAAEGDVLIDNNVIKNVGWNAVQVQNVPFYTGDNTDKSDKSTIYITNNVFENAGADEGIINVNAPTDKGQVAKAYVNENKLLAKNNTQNYICYAQDYKVEAKNNFWGIGVEGASVIDTDYANKLMNVNNKKVGGSSGFNMPYYKTEAMNELYFEAKIGDKDYPTVTNALSNAKEGDTIVVLENATIGTSNAYRGDIILDLGGNTLTVTNDLSVTDETTLTIKNGTIDLGANGTISVGISDARFAGGELVVEEDVVITGSGSANIIVWNGKLNTAGTITNTGYGRAITGNGTWDTTEINITGGTVKSEADTAIYHPQSGKLTISGGTVEGDTAIVLKGGNLEIIDGVLIADGAANEYKPLTSGYVITGDALQVEHMDDREESDYYGTPVVSVKGGTFISKNGNAVGSYANQDMEQLVDFIEGGSFSSDVSSYCKSGYSATINNNGTYSITGLPVAKVEKKPARTLTKAEDEYFIYDAFGGGSLTDGQDLPLNVILDFEAIDNEATVASSPYKDYITDFYITVEGLSSDSFKAEGCYLAGKYGEYPWVIIPIDSLTIEEGAVNPVMAAFSELTYEAVCTDVKLMTCAMYIAPEILEANPDIKVTLDLGLKASASDEKYLTVDSKNYDAKDFEGNIWYSATDSGSYILNETTYGLVRFLFNIDTAENVKTAGIKFNLASDITEQIEGTQKEISMATSDKVFYGDVTEIDNGNDATVYAKAYVVTENNNVYWSDAISTSVDWTKLFDKID